MPTKLKSPITTDVGRRLPRKRPPTHPGEMLLEEFVKPLNLTQTELARLLERFLPSPERNYQRQALGNSGYCIAVVSCFGYVCRFLARLATGLGSLACHE